MREENSEVGMDFRGTVTFPLFVHAVLLLLGLWGCLAIYNATVYSNAPFHFALRQFIWLIIGFACMFCASKIPFSQYMKHAPWLAAAFFIPLVLVLFLGVRINGMRGWYAFGSVFIQPSEMAKPFYILVLCWISSLSAGSLKKFMLLMMMALVWLLPVAAQPDFGTVIIYVFGMLAVYLISGGSYLMLVFPFLAAIPASIWVILEKPYVLMRLKGFIDPMADPTGSGWHIMQFHYTLARGGFFGVNWGNCLWANSYLPLSYSDSAFASLTEAIGFIGVLPVIFGFSLFAYVGYRLAERADSDFRRLFICSMTAMITFQAFVHISVNVGLMPPTGITLPMFSYGGSSLVSTMLGAGIILSAAKKEPENGHGRDQASGLMN
ncbi:MAG: hypothetical protein A2X48_12645 [Lentisphaerae bacterium GWF2_49_21]|nr:MAG: hypothetical protein A2X48_12645 [Lentisphaerae bacterium GWF2_49_21]